MDHHVVTDYTSSTAIGNDHIKVFVRARPPDGGGDPPEEMWARDKEQPQKITIRDPNRHVGEHAFLFDDVLWTDTSQETVFHKVAKPLLNHCMNGYNGCCFAYGQTGSGKTYTMFGKNGAEQGIISRSISYLFREIEKRKRKEPKVDFAILVSFLEMYCDEIRDLGKEYCARKDKAQNVKARFSTITTAKGYLEKLHQGDTTPDPTSSGGGLRIHEDVEGNVFVKNLTLIPVTTEDEVISIVDVGFKMRTTHETKMNTYSSRSHTVFTVTVMQTNQTSGVIKTGSLNLVDLAGSERLRKSESEGQRLREALFINTSLSTLGKVIMTLDPSLPAAYIPYRDSKLTRLLQNSLGGNSHTSVVATLHPTKENYEECLDTCQFANRCRNVMNQPSVNYKDKAGKGMVATIKRLQMEVKRLRFVIAAIVAKKNKQIADIMGQLGFKHSVVNKDGTVTMEDGSIVGTKLDLNAIESEVNAKIIKSEAKPEAVNAEFGEELPEGELKLLGTEEDFALFGSSTMSSNDPFNDEESDEAFMYSSMPKPLLQRYQTIRAQGAKYKKEVEQTKRQHKEKLQAVFTAEQSQKRKIGELEEKLEQQRQLHKAELARLQEQYFGNLNKIIGRSKHSQELLQEHLRKIPEELRIDSMKIHKAQQEVRSITQILNAKHATHLKALESDRVREIDNVKKQCEYWLSKRDKECKRLVDDFNAYHAKRVGEMEEYRHELRLLYKHCAQLTTVIHNIQRGVYKVKSNGQLLRNTVCIDESDYTDANLLRDSTRLKLLKDTMRNLAEFQKSQLTIEPHKEASVCDDSRIENVVLQESYKAETKVRPGARLTKLHVPNNDIGNGQNNLDVLKGVEFKGRSLDEDPDALSPRSLRHHCKSLHEYVNTDFVRQTIQTNASKALSSHPTLRYIRTLEEALDEYKSKDKSQKQSNKDLRNAYVSMKRQYAKLRREYTLLKAKTTPA